jgi:hypothetical protein
MAIHGFVLEEGTKPGDERDLQVCPTLLQTCLSGNPTDSLPKPLKHLTGGYKQKACHGICRHLDNLLETDDFYTL